MKTAQITEAAATTTLDPSARPRCPFAGVSAREPVLPAVAAIAHWLATRDATAFPYEAVVAEFNRVGKHFVVAPLLETLANVRAILPEARGPAASVHLLDRFLDVALDKLDGRYANPTYLGLSLLPLPVVDDVSTPIDTVERRYDRLLVQLMADAARFEIAAAQGATGFLPELRPDSRTTAKRCRLALQVAGPAARRLGLDDGVETDDAIAGATRLWANLAATLSPAERRTLQLTMLPVSLVHDEYQFIRVLQAFEATFALMAVEIQAAIQALASEQPARAIPRLLAAESALREAAPLFSLVGTMQLAAFQTFREFTDGASAIQSRHYKLVESLCRQPDPDRLDSYAYHSVPEVRQRVMAGQVSLDDALAAARAAGRLDAGELDGLEGAMRRFAATLLRWRRTHYRLAARMLGERTGTGYTEGAPYLKAVQAIPVFQSVAQEPAGETPDGDGSGKPLPAENLTPTAPKGRCPFAAGFGSLQPAMAGAGRNG